MKTNIVIAGVGPGIGIALAKGFSMDNYGLYLISRGDIVKSYARELGVQYSQCDLRNYKETESAIIKAKESLGIIDAVIIVAGNYYSMDEIEKTDSESFQEALLNNAVSFYNVSKACVPLMREQKHGNIIGFSAAENVYLNSNMGYSAGKGAVYFMIRSLAHELMSSNIKVNGIAPGFIAHSGEETASKISENGKYHPDGIVKAIKFLIENEMITGEIINVAGGHNIKIEPGI